MDSLEKIQRDVVIAAFNNGMTTEILNEQDEPKKRNGVILKSIGDQPAPWYRDGLKILESGRELTIEAIELINLSGGTDHPDPTLSC
jgi:hypothetical protein